MGDKGKLGLSPNGNGGVFESLSKTGALDWFEGKGVDFLHLCGVDNVLLKVCDPVFLGFAHTQNVDIANKVVEKLSWDENVGVLAMKGGKIAVVEYSELSEEMAKQRGEGDSLAYGFANVVNHIIKTSFVRRVISDKLDEMRGLYHMAQKKVPFYAEGGVVKPTEPNGLKFELFYFDVLPLSNDSAAFVVSRESEFAPVKNAAGPDSPESARLLLANEHARWLESRGAVVPADGRAESYVEISPLVSYGGEGLKSFAGRQLDLPFSLNN